MKAVGVLIRCVKYCAVVIFGIALLYFTLRSDSNFGSISWMPSGLTRFVQKPIYLRNFWGFLPIGGFVALAYGRWPILWRWERRFTWSMLLLFSLPIVKEVVQIPLENRHCNWLGMAAGVGGLLVGLMLGLGIKWALIFYRTKMKPSLPLQIS